MRTHWILLITLLAFAMSSCRPTPANWQNADSMPTEALTHQSQEPLATHLPDLPLEGDIPEMTPTLSSPSLSNLQQLIEKAREDLAQRLSVSISQIDLVDATEVVWSNSSLGCPQPGMLYTEVLTRGYLIVLSVNNQNYEYHAGKSSNVFLCENPIPPVPDIPGDT